MNKYSLKQQTDAIYRRFVTLPRRPVIGITANYDEHSARLAEGYYKQVVAAGGDPLIIPPCNGVETLNGTLNHIDGLLLTGGADINPLFMGQEPVPQLGHINAERDLPELLITRMAFNRQMPILGICRGIQTLAVALDGQVEQHIGNGIKHSQDADRHVPTHTVSVEQGSTLYNIMEHGGKSSPLYVNSFHHQAVSDPGPHLRVVATAPDGVVEAVESNEYKSILGVQWHPECMTADDGGLLLFQWLVGEARTYRQIQRLHNRVLTLDTHCDTPMKYTEDFDFTMRNDGVCIDLPKMTEGRLDAAIMVAYIPQTMAANPPGSPDSPFNYANTQLDRIEKFREAVPHRLYIARTFDHLWQNKRVTRKSIMMGIENGLALEGQLSNVEHFARRGVVYITLCHNGSNDICDSAKGEPLHGGVSPFGEQVIHEMNRLGMMVDLSHAAESSFYDALDMSSKPIVCTHSSCRALCDHPRNLTDDQLRALARKGGVCQITLYPGFLRQDGQATILDAIEHLKHAIEVMGIDFVGLGTDFDGDGGVPGLADASELTLFTRQLLQASFSEEDIQKIWGGNFLRVMKQIQSRR